MIYITGDTHRDFARIARFCKEHHTTKKNDLMIILGDAGINFYGRLMDMAKKLQIQKIPITFFCIHGNHEMRPENVIDTKGRPAYTLVKWHGGMVYREAKFPHLLFAHDGDCYQLNGYSVLVCGGAYSPDKLYRQMYHQPWFPDEQPNDAIKAHVEEQVLKQHGKVDIVLTHTIPLKFLPALHLKPLSGIDQATEAWLDSIEGKLNYQAWYAGHFHVNQKIGKLQILFDEIQAFPKGGIIL